MRAHMQLSPVAIITAPASLPAWLDGLGASEDQLRDWGWAGHVGEGSWPIVETREPFDPETETETGPLATIDESQRTVTHAYGKRNLTSEELEAFRDGLRARAAAARYAKETGGLTVAGIPVQTDRESQGLINGALALVTAAPTTVIRFKAGSGFVDLDATMMTAVAVSVGQHVQGAFATEANVAAQIAAGEVTTAEQVDAAFA